MSHCIHQIICPNCGSPAAERHQIAERQIERTQCPECDYLLVMCQRTNQTIEAYAPGLDVARSIQAILRRNSAAKL